MSQSTCPDRSPDLAAESRDWQAWQAGHVAQEQQCCRQILNQHYNTDYFTHVKVEGSNYGASQEEQSSHQPPPFLAPQCVTHVQHQRPLSNSPMASTPADPAHPCPSQRYGEVPNPRPWEAPPPRRRKGVYVGRQPDLCPLKLVHHPVPWNRETRNIQRLCPLWHCRLPHMRSNLDRPW
ncbi:uncharacterized protein LOC101859090 [Aplysia californica]|uniref:Uncharacterized protein LOC101859090 n=1 Tax=Aplysia californica TaxID=6500 RepID=A0ABM0JJP7_APLCA|nr:uncharacterized protein LOC101859090 [Aplysia californica]